MLFNFVSLVLVFLSWKLSHSFSILSIFSALWFFIIPPFSLWVGGWVSWFVMWELSSLELIADTTESCGRKRGGTMELSPGRLGFRDWATYCGCLGRVGGHDHPIYGNMVLVGSVLVLMAITSSIWVVAKYAPSLNRLVLRLRALFSVLAEIVSFQVGVISFLVELFVVTKPVEISRGVLVDTITYEHLIRTRDEMNERFIECESKVAGLEQIANWCKTYHANPDAAVMKVQQQQLAASQRELSHLSSDYTALKSHCTSLEFWKEDLRDSDIPTLQKTIYSKEAEILVLQKAITALEARPDSEHLETERKRAGELQQKLDAQIQEGIATDITAGLQKEEITRLQTSNKSLLSETKAAELRAQSVASGHTHAMGELKKRVEEAESIALSIQSQLGQAQDEINANIDSANAAVQSLQQELEATRAEHQKQFGNEVKAMRNQLQGQYEEQLQAAQTGLAKAAEADIESRVQAKITSAILAAFAEREAADAALANLTFDDDEFN